VACLFIFLTMSFEEQKSKSNFSVFPFKYAFVSCF
jgi:hypothetical protein